MTWIDSRGRLFGRINLIDAAVILALFACGPLAFSAWWLFREPVPALSLIEPRVLAPQTETRVKVTGQYLRPYLSAVTGPSQAIWLWQDFDHAEITVPATLPIGTYDVAIFDAAREVARLPQYLSVAIAVPDMTEITALVDHLAGWRRDWPSIRAHWAPPVERP